MTHSEMEELYELYLLSALELDEAAEITRHLEDSCEHCLSRLRRSSELTAALGLMAPQAVPSTRLRPRVLSIAAPAQPRRHFAWPVAFAMALAASFVLLIWVIQASDRSSELMRQRDDLRGALAILSEGNTKTVSFGQAQTDPQGHVFISRNDGLVFIGNRLPALTAGRTFEFWLVPAKGNPRPAGLFKTNAQGIAVNVFAKSINPADYAAVAVSVEPSSGSPQPTSKPILIVPLA